jgi:hypothetical protein
MLYRYEILIETKPDKYLPTGDPFEVDAETDEEAGAAAQAYIEQLAAEVPGTYAAQRIPDADEPSAA